MKTQKIYSKAAILLILLGPLMLLAQPTQSGYIPFHDYLLKNHSTIQQDKDGMRGLITIYEEIAYLHDVAVQTPVGPGWTYADSGTFVYTPAAVETNGNNVTYTGLGYSWNNNTQFTNTYDANNELLSTTGQVWDTGSSAWVNNYNYAYTYNNGQITSEVYSTWNAGTSNFDYVFNYNYTYNGNTLASLVYQNWTGTTWQNDTQYIYTFNGQGQLSQSITQLWNTGSSTWVNTLNQNYNYDANGNNILTLSYAWNGPAWVNYSIAYQSFNQVNVLADYVFLLWDSNTTTYLKNYQEQYLFDYNYNNTSFENFNWDNTNNVWVPIHLYQYTYDEYGNDTYEVDANYSNGGFTQTDQYFYTYSSFQVNSISAFSNPLNAELYPNPSCNQTLFAKFNADEASSILINVYDEMGRRVYNESQDCARGQNTLQLNLPALSAGNYYLRIADLTSGKGSAIKFVRD